MIYLMSGFITNNWYLLLQLSFSQFAAHLSWYFIAQFYSRFVQFRKNVNIYSVQSQTFDELRYKIRLDVNAKTKSLKVCQIFINSGQFCHMLPISSISVKIKDPLPEASIHMRSPHDGLSDICALLNWPIKGLQPFLLLAICIKSEPSKTNSTFDCRFHN